MGRVGYSLKFTISHGYEQADTGAKPPMRSSSKRCLQGLTFFVLVMLLWSGPGQAGEEQRRWRLGSDLRYGLYLDDSGALGVEEVMALKADSFMPLCGVMALGYTRAAVWLRFEPPPLAPGQHDWWLEVAPSYLDTVDLYQNDGSQWSVQHAGDWRPFAERAITHRHFVFSLRPDGQGPIFLRLQSASSMVGILTLWEPGAFVAADTHRTLAWGLHLGAFAMLTVLMALLAVVFRNRELAIIALVGSFNLLAMAATKGFLAEWLWPSQPRVASHAVGWISTWMLASACWMMRELLTRGTRQRWLDRCLMVATGLFVLAPLSLAIDRYGEFMGPLYLLHALAAVMGVWVALIRVREHAGIYELAILTAFVIYVSVVVPLLLVLLGILGQASTLMSVWIVVIPLFLTISAVAQTLRIRRHYCAMAVARDQALDAARAAERRLEGEVRLRTSELVRAQEKLRASLEFERRLRLEQRHLVDMLSHEFRTPLAIVDAVATNLTAVPPADGLDLRRRVDQIRRATGSLAQLIANYLNNDLLERGAFEASVRVTAIEPLIAEVSRLVARSPRHIFLVDPSEAPPFWSLDPFLIRIALNNLIDNAFKYAPPGEVCLTVRADEDSESLSLMVSDLGTGISSEEAERIFDKFQRGRRISGIRGTGLGLFICREIARVHGGGIHLRMGDDSLMGGVTFEIRLPLHPM